MRCRVSLNTLSNACISLSLSLSLSPYRMPTEVQLKIHAWCFQDRLARAQHGHGPSCCTACCITPFFPEIASSYCRRGAPLNPGPTDGGAPMLDQLLPPLSLSSPARFLSPRSIHPSRRGEKRMGERGQELVSPLLRWVSRIKAHTA